MDHSGQSVSEVLPGLLQLNHEFPVRRAGSAEFVRAIGELGSDVDNLLLELGDALLECVDVGRGAEAGLLPGFLADGFGEPAFELSDVPRHAGVAFGQVSQVGEQGLPADLWPGWSVVGLSSAGHHRGVQVRVPVDQAAMHSGAAASRVCPFRVQLGCRTGRTRISVLFRCEPRGMRITWGTWLLTLTDAQKDNLCKLLDRDLSHDEAQEFGLLEDVKARLPDPADTKDATRVRITEDVAAMIRRWCDSKKNPSS